MPIFLRLNTQDRHMAINLALQLASFYEADVCGMDNVKANGETKEGCWVIVLKASRQEVAMANLGKQQEDAFLEEVQQRLALFGDQVTCTELQLSRFISPNQTSFRVTGDRRLILHLQIDLEKATVKPAEFARALHSNFFNETEISIATSDLSPNQCEIRIKQKAVLGISDAAIILDRFNAALEQMAGTAEGYALETIMASAEPFDKVDYAFGHGALNVTTLANTCRFDPIYLDENNRQEWVNDANKLQQMSINFEPTTFTVAQLQRLSTPVLELVKQQDETAFYKVNKPFLVELARKKQLANLLDNMAKGTIVQIELLLRPTGSADTPGVFDGKYVATSATRAVENNLNQYIARLLLKDEELLLACAENRAQMTIIRQPNNQLSANVSVAAVSQQKQPAASVSAV